MEWPARLPPVGGGGVSRILFLRSALIIGGKCLRYVIKLVYLSNIYVNV